MHLAHRLAEFLVISWRLGAGDERIPTSHGILDRALREVAEKDLFPKWAKDELHFSDSRVGLQCVELPEILEWAQRSQLTSSPNPSYESTAIKISEQAAKDIAEDTGLTVEQLRSCGAALYRSAQRAIKEQSEFEHANIEAY